MVIEQSERPGARGVRGRLRGLVAARPGVERTARNAWRSLARFVEPGRAVVEDWVDFTLRNSTEHEWRMLTQHYDDRVPLPPSAGELRRDHPALVELRTRYAEAPAAVTVPSVWNENLLAGQSDLRYFRGENQYVWNYREWPRAMELKYFVFAEYVRARDSNGLLSRLREDGAFGCWTFEYPGFPLVSRDLLDSVNELSFLDRQIGLLRRSDLRVLDIGAGYGRMAYRMIQVADVADYCCLDAVPESTFLCEYYLRHRACVPPARVVPLPDVDDALAGATFDLALNIHSFSECTFDAVEWWFERLARLKVPYVLVVPNDRDQLLTCEPDGTRRDFAPLVAAAGYELCACEPVIDDPAVRALLRHDDQFLLFGRTG